MEKNYLLEVIRTLKPEEITQVRYFANVPLFNSGRMRLYVIPLIDLLVNSPWPFQKLDKKEVFAKLFPGQQFVEGKIEKTMVEANKVVKAFLLAQKYFQESNEFNQWLDFVEVVKKRGLRDRYEYALGRLQKIQSQSSKGNVDFFYHQLLLDYTIHEDYALHNQAKGDLYIPDALNSLETHYHLKRLILLNQYLVQQKIAHLEVPESVDRAIKNEDIPKSCIEESILLKINFEIFKLLKKVSPAAFEIKKLFDLLSSREEQIDSKILIDFYNYLRNLCVLSVASNYENLEMAHLLNEIYKNNLDRGYLHRDGKIGASKYLGVANNALLVGDNDWAFNFIENYKDEVHSENGNRDIYRLNLAHYYFRVGRFSDCIDSLPEFFSVIGYFLLLKRLEIKAYYELQSDLLPYKLDAFKMYLSRTSQKVLSTAQRKSHIDFANLLTQIISSAQGNERRSELLIKRIREKKTSAEWRWLLEKAQALRNKR